jgi:Flp pilus assembly pilin Flp
MRCKQTSPIQPARQRGNAAVEYTVIAAALAVALFAVGTPAGRTLTQAIQAFYSDLTFFLSLP